MGSSSLLHRRLRRLAAIAAALCAPFGHAQTPTEAQVKAAYVLNFAKFTEWPASAFPTTGGALQVCVLASAETAAGFTAIQGKPVQGRDVLVRHGPRLGELHTCHVLYAEASERAAAAQAVKSLAGRPVLTVSDVDGFIDAGGMLQLVLVDGRIRFDANREAAGTHGLRLRSQLLALARVVR
ncbi:MAG: YfiR family protein [Burkholderiales bacterium]|nr:YfiR family protein [Burkholderiales bacterium]